MFKLIELTLGVFEVVLSASNKQRLLPLEAMVGGLVWGSGGTGLLLCGVQSEDGTRSFRGTVANIGFLSLTLILTIILS